MELKQWIKIIVHSKTNLTHTQKHPLAHLEFDSIKMVPFELASHFHRIPPKMRSLHLKLLIHQNYTRTRSLEQWCQILGTPHTHNSQWFLDFTPVTRSSALDE